MTDERKGCLLFDWGNTLMRELDGYAGAMVDWPQVEAMPNADVALAALQPEWRMAVATNAAASTGEQVRAALGRVGLDSFFERIYCARDLGLRKPTGEFFTAVLKDLGLEAGQVVMVGDDFETDILGAVRWGLRAVWLNEASQDRREGPLYRTIHDLSELPGVLLWRM